MVSFRLSLNPRRRSLEKKKDKEQATSATPIKQQPTEKELPPIPSSSSSSPSALPRQPLTPRQTNPSAPRLPAVTAAFSPPIPQVTLGPTILRSNLTHRRTGSRANSTSSTASQSTPASSATPTRAPSPDLPTSGTSSSPAVVEKAIPTPPQAIVFKVPQLRICVPSGPAACSSSSEYTPSTPGSAYTPSFGFSPLCFTFPMSGGAGSAAAGKAGGGEGHDRIEEETGEADDEISAREKGRGALDQQEVGEAAGHGPLMMRVLQRI